MMLHWLAALTALYMLGAPALGPGTRTHTTGVGVAPQTRADSVILRAQLELAITEFEVQWQHAWRLSEQDRHVGTGELRRLRAPYQHCHPDVIEARRVDAANRNAAPGTPMVGMENVFRPDTQYNVISSANTRFATCPTWLLSATIPDALEETRWIDGAIAASRRMVVGALRATLLATLDSAAHVIPADGWLTGQRVRFRLDQRDLGGARAAAMSCRADRWWCEALHGLVMWIGNQPIAADSVFGRMRAMMPDTTRCAWSNVASLIAAKDRAAYLQMNCQARQAAEERLWWLSDPLYRERGNARLTEQEARRVIVALHRGTIQDERFEWDPKRGGDAVEELIARYGWPSYTGWGGDVQDDSHSVYLTGHDSPVASPYTTFEYAPGRVHTIPLWHAIAMPFESSDADWNLVGEDSTHHILLEWWPIEHFPVARPLVQLDQVQVGAFRRQGHALVAVGARLEHPALVADGASEEKEQSLLDVLLLASRAPGVVDSVAQSFTRVGTTAVLRGVVGSEPIIVGVEARCVESGCGDARSRLGLVPPPTLATMAAGEVAISDPVLLEFTRTDSTGVQRSLDVNAPGEHLLDFIRGGTALRSDERKVALYWESYGIKAADTVTVSVRITSVEALSRLRRVGIALNLTIDPNTSAQYSWREPDPGHTTRTLAGPVPVQMRAVALDLRQLAAGPYVVEVSITRDAKTIVRGQRRLVLK